MGILAWSGVSRADRLVRPGELVHGAKENAALQTLVKSPLEACQASGQSRGPGRPSGGHGARGYKNLLAPLVITRDLRLPGAEFVAVRVIPTKKELGGDSRVPIVLRPRLIGTTWYGIDVIARF